MSHTFPSFGDCARAWLQEREAEAQSGELAYHTIVSYRRTVRVLIEALGSIIVNEVGREHLRKMHGDNRGRPTVANQALNIARRILRDAEDAGLRARGSSSVRIRHHPELASSRPAAPRDVLRVFATCAEVRAGRLPICHPTAAALFQLVALTGARPSEIRELEWSMVDLDADPPELRIPRHKTSRTIGEKTIVLHPLALGVIISLNPSAPAHPRWVFPSHVVEEGCYSDIAKPWRRVALAAGVGRVNLRDLRSGVATNAYDRGVPIELVKQMLGHRALSTTLRYTHINSRKVAHAYDVMHSATFSKPRTPRR